ncbi:hypothetical protein KW785_02655 [Candidatus Parcubacteria bacterium]|nr:hypothetical protein [Candidatus Parcubacteria bacterium]
MQNLDWESDDGKVCIAFLKTLLDGPKGISDAERLISFPGDEDHWDRLSRLITPCLYDPGYITGEMGRDEESDGGTGAKMFYHITNLGRGFLAQKEQALSPEPHHCLSVECARSHEG